MTRILQRDPFHLCDSVKKRLHRYVDYLIIARVDQQRARFDLVQLLNCAPVFQVSRRDQF